MVPAARLKVGDWAGREPLAYACRAGMEPADQRHCRGHVMEQHVGRGMAKSVVAWMLFCVLFAVSLTGCAPQSTEKEERRPQQAGEPLDPLKTAGRFGAMQATALTGDRDGFKRNFESMHGDLMRSMRVPDATRRIDREAARTAVREVAGIRSAGWIDHENLLVRVDSNELRSQRTIDRLCMELEPLGDTLAVVIHVQSAAARSGEEMRTLSRNCQLQPGERAFMQRQRQMDVIPDDVRRQHRAAQQSMRNGDEGREARREEARRILEASTPEM